MAQTTTETRAKSVRDALHAATRHEHTSLNYDPSWIGKLMDVLLGANGAYAIDDCGVSVDIGIAPDSEEFIKAIARYDDGEVLLVLVKKDETRDFPADWYQYRVLAKAPEPFDFGGPYNGVTPTDMTSDLPPDAVVTIEPLRSGTITRSTWTNTHGTKVTLTDTVFPGYSNISVGAEDVGCTLALNTRQEAIAYAATIIPGAAARKLADELSAEVQGLARKSGVTVRFVDYDESSTCNNVRITGTLDTIRANVVQTASGILSLIAGIKGVVLLEFPEVSFPHDLVSADNVCASVNFLIA